MKFEQFYTEYRNHDGENPIKKQRRFDGYELHFENGDVYIYDEELKPGAMPSSYSKCYMSDDFTTSSTWNGQRIEH